MALNKKRLDQILLERNPNFSRTYIQSLIMQGRVRVNASVITKSGSQFPETITIDVDVTEPKYVSRAGHKLEKALQHFDISVEGMIVLDAGLSTGGFADCLLQHGATKIYGVDVGYGQVHEKIRNNPKVVVMERTNVRYLPTLPEKVDLITLDLSFISVLKVLDAVVAQLKEGGKLIILIKPQFEAARHHVGKGGIVNDDRVHQEVIHNVVAGVEAHGFICKGVIESPLVGADGNKEFLAFFSSLF